MINSYMSSMWVPSAPLGISPSTSCWGPVMAYRPFLLEMAIRFCFCTFSDRKHCGHDSLNCSCSPWHPCVVPQHVATSHLIWSCCKRLISRVGAMAGKSKFDPWTLVKRHGHNCRLYNYEWTHDTSKRQPPVPLLPGGYLFLCFLIVISTCFFLASSLCMLTNFIHLGDKNVFIDHLDMVKSLLSMILLTMD